MLAVRKGLVYSQARNSESCALNSREMSTPGLWMASIRPRDLRCHNKEVSRFLRPRIPVGMGGTPRGKDSRACFGNNLLVP